MEERGYSNLVHIGEAAIEVANAVVRITFHVQIIAICYETTKV